MKSLYQLLITCVLLPATLSAAPVASPRQDFWHTRGSQIVDSRGQVVRIVGVSWWGLETERFAPLGLDKRPMNDILAEVHSMGFNVVRLPYSNEMLHPGSKPVGIDYTINPDLKGLTPLEVMDYVIASAKANGLRVILDRHRPGAAGQSALWYTPQYSEQQWIADWTMLAGRYRDNDTVVAFDLHNEPRDPATWGSGDLATDWRLAAERAGNAVLAVNPHVLVMVEGVSKVGNDTYWWGGNLSAAKQFPVRLTRPQQLVYSSHDYPPSVAEQSWFKASDFPANLSEVWTAHWGFLAGENKTPVVLGEFGTRNATPQDRAWLAKLVGYLATRKIGAMYWSLNPESADTGGLLQPDWKTQDQGKLVALAPILSAAATPAATTRKPAQRK
jgi:aryl-phospho-beta-D-glucosidase BglC (GH1 family)